MAARDAAALQRALGQALAREREMRRAPCGGGGGGHSLPSSRVPCAQLVGFVAPVPPGDVAPSLLSLSFSLLSVPYFVLFASRLHLALCTDIWERLRVM